MATSSTTSTVYVHVIEDVINKVRDEFINNGGPGESVLNELEGLWEMKMIQAGVICGPIDRSSTSKQASGAPITPVHDLNVPYEGTEEYETPTAEMLFPPTPLQTPIQTPLPGSAQTPLPGNVPTPLPGNVQTPLPGSVDNSSIYNIPTGPTSEYSTPASDTGGSTEAKAGRPSHYMQPPSPWMNQRPPLDVNIAYVEGRDEADKGASQQTLTQDFFMMSSGKRKREDFGTQYKNGEFIPQQDGAGDAYSEALQIYNYQGVVNEDYNIANTPAPNDLQASTPAVAPQNDAGDDDEDEPLNEDDDDDDLDDVEQGEDINTHHLVLAQFDKVTRTKSRWKCTLKDGIMHINNKDILFNKATGEFDF
ncbi:transcription initiation factor IIA large subunit isoform X2 [Manihot esculenta]|uniref:transcription initiation factor IIA large subunit isoform X2 n=1 Tax=Manihot esculenta TaxID=3983 RepID=UPI000B5D2C32|nr:transcription initiation factor IIA large subunit isoform X2 [Manihot esculenta]